MADTRDVRQAEKLIKIELLNWTLTRGRPGHPTFRVSERRWLQSFRDPQIREGVADRVHEIMYESGDTLAALTNDMNLPPAVCGDVCDLLALTAWEGTPEHILIDGKPHSCADFLPRL